MKNRLIYLTLIASLGLAGVGVIYESTKTEPNQEIKQEQNLEQITFEQAKLNPSLRQNYLDQILENKDKVGDPLWNSFKRLIYDHNFEKFKENHKKYGMEETTPPSRVMAATTHIGKLKGKKQVSFFCKDCFDDEFILSEDEILSCIDNESLHAYMAETHQLPPYLFERGYKYIKTGKESYRVENRVVEAVSFDVQFSNINNGKRKVSDRFIQDCAKTYFDIFSELQDISKQNNDDSELAKAILKALKYTPKEEHE